MADRYRLTNATGVPNQLHRWLMKTIISLMKFILHYVTFFSYDCQQLLNVKSAGRALLILRRSATFLASHS